MKWIEKAMRGDFDNANDAADFAFRTRKYMHLGFPRKRFGYRHFDIDECLTLINRVRIRDRIRCRDNARR